MRQTSFVTSENGEYTQVKEYCFTISAKAEIMDDNSCQDYINQLKERKEFIQDINVTCKMEPFTADAHAVVMNQEDNDAHIEQMLYVQEQTGINISLVFNNIYIPNDTENLKMFMKNFYKYYKMGIRNITLPHILWMKTGEIQKEYPELYIKSTVLRRVSDGQEFWNYAMAGFDCINVDRRLFRKLSALRDIKKAQAKYNACYGKYVDISMIINEGCIGNCPFWEEHYQHSMTSKLCLNEQTNRVGFKLVHQYSGCTDYDNICLSRVNLVGFKEDFDSIFENIDLIKIGGRRRRVNAFKIIDSIMDDNNVCHYLLQNVLIHGIENDLKLVERWRMKTKNCGYQCWNCDLCKQLDEIIFNYLHQHKN